MHPTMFEQRLIFRTCLGGRQVTRCYPCNTKTSSNLISQKAVVWEVKEQVISQYISNVTPCVLGALAGLSDDPYVEAT